MDKTTQDLSEAYLCGYWTHQQLIDFLHLSEESVKEILHLARLRANPKPKPRMLFLDDRRKRIEAAQMQFGEKYDLTIVSNVKECLRALSSEDWDEVRLDHDLNGDDFQDIWSSEAGMEVVRYITNTGWPPNKKKPIFRVHSSNIFASYLMVKTLQEAGHIAVWERFEYKDGIQCGS